MGQVLRSRDPGETRKRVEKKGRRGKESRLTCNLRQSPQREWLLSGYSRYKLEDTLDINYVSEGISTKVKDLGFHGSNQPLAAGCPREMSLQTLPVLCRQSSSRGAGDVLPEAAAHRGWMVSANSKAGPGGSELSSHSNCCMLFAQSNLLKVIRH